MNELQRIKIALKTLMSLGTAKNQQEIGRLMGYSSKSSFSQVLNGKVNLPADFINRLCELNILLDKEWLTTGNGNVLKNSCKGIEKKNKYLSLITAEDLTAYICGSTTVSSNNQQFLIPVFEDADYLIIIRDSSMHPNYQNGDIAACKHLPAGTLFQWNKVYVILSTKLGVLIKRVCRSDNDNFIALVSDNKDYDTFEIPKSELLAASIVTGIIRVE
ncbi:MULTISPECIES: helix-turn-helix transcriptional regulator [Flavobacterium]|uniref:S24 family peptidase n=1 Tax=Flavobacterium TaxID=237 RepID=UPI0021156ADE|nr:MULTISPECIES: S24 family peptidase [Flavobacterium]UUF13089.1 S24 family peptidase [Flavobacterium panici]